MRRIILAMAIVVAMPHVGHADDAALPPPQIIKRKAGGTIVHAPAVPRPPAARPASLPKATPPALRSSPGRAASPGPSADALQTHLRGTSIATPDPSGRARPAALQPAPSQRDIERTVDGYLGDARSLIAPASVGGGSGYDDGFLIRGGGFSLRTNIILQTRFEAFEWNDAAPSPGGDRSGFSLPRAVVRFSGDAPPYFKYLVELDFGGEGGPLAWDNLQGCIGCTNPNLGPDSHTHGFDELKEAWIEYNHSKALNARLGLIRTPTTRQLMVRPEFQQFVDISLASAWVGLGMSGYSDRNRDYGLMLHGVACANDQVAWAFTATNGDGGDAVRNVIDVRSSDNLAYAARVNWAFLEPIGFQEGALRQQTNRTYGEIGAWAYYYADRLDRPHTTEGDYLRAGVDLALGYGPWSFTGAISFTDDQDVGGTNDDSSTAWLAQVGFHFPQGPLEIAARWSGYDTEGDLTGDGTAQEFGVAINYYLNGHGNKLQLDASYIDTDSGGFLILDPYAAYPAFLGSGDSGWLLRLQWQMGL